MDVDPGYGFSSLSLDKLGPLSTHNSYWSLLDEVALSNTFPLTERTDENLLVLQSPLILLPGLCNASVILLRLFLAVPEKPTWNSAADNSQLQWTVQWTVQGLAVSQWHSWEAAQLSRERIKSATSASVPPEESPAAATPSSSTFPDVTRSFLPSLQSGEAVLQGHMDKDILFLFSACLKVTVGIIRHSLEKQLLWFNPPCVCSLQSHSAELRCVLC